MIRTVADQFADVVALHFVVFDHEQVLDRTFDEHLDLAEAGVFISHSILVA